MKLSIFIQIIPQKPKRNRSKNRNKWYDPLPIFNKIYFLSGFLINNLYNVPNMFKPIIIITRNINLLQSRQFDFEFPGTNMESRMEFKYKTTELIKGIKENYLFNHYTRILCKI